MRFQCNKPLSLFVGWLVQACPGACVVRQVKAATLGRCGSQELFCTVAAGPMVGARLVLPGPYLDGENIFNLMDTYKVTISTGQSECCHQTVGCCSWLPSLMH